MQQLTEPSAANLQKQVYNSNIGGGLNKRETYSLPAGTAWAVVGTVVADAATPADVPMLKSRIKALAEVQVAEPLCWGQQPIIQAEAHDAVLFVTARLSQTIAIGGGKTFPQRTDWSVSRILPGGKKWIVWALKVPATLNQAGVTALTAALRTVIGITAIEHLFDGQVDAEAVGLSVLAVTCHVRIDPIPELPPEE